MLNNFAATQQGGTGTVTTTTILDGTIANADVASDAAIAISKIDLGNTVEIETSSGDQIFEMDNNASNSSNFQINNGAGNARTDFYLDGSAILTLKNQMVGIGDTSPSYALDVNDTGRFTSDLIVGGNLTVGDGGAEDQKVVFNGNAQDFYVGLDDSADDLLIGLGSAVGTTPAISINEDRDVTISDGAIDFDVASHDGTNGLKLGGALVTSSATELNLLDGVSSLGTGDASGPGSATDNAIARFDGTGGKTLQNSSTTISDNGDIVVGGTTPTITIGDGGAEDAALIFDGNAKDFHLGLDDSADKLVIGVDSTLGTNSILTLTDDTVTVGDGAAVDTAIVFDGNAKDFYVALDDSADKLLIGEGSTVGTNPILSITDDTVTLGDGAAVDTAIVFDGNAKDFYVALDDSADKLVIGEGSTVGTNSILTITDDTVTVGDGAAVDTYINFDGNAVDYRIGLDDGTDKLEIGAGTAHGTTAAITIDSSADMTLGGSIACADEVISRPRFTDYAETINAIGGTGGGTQDIDITAGNVVSATVDTSANTFTFSNPSATGKACSFTLFLTNGGSQTVNWPGAVDWAGGSAPSLTSSGVDVLTFSTLDAGTIWYGFAAGTDMK